jgi:hypothetical protein
MDGDVLIRREGRKDKEFALQDWVKGRLGELGEPFSENGRNKAPDFPLDDGSEGYEVKGLATHGANGRPGRITTYDSNSHVPTGTLHGQTVYYVFGRYPQSSDREYPVHDLVICHGDFLNPQSDYVHKNKRFKTFGGYGDIMIRDRKMYVVRTPFNLVNGLLDHRTLIIPAGDPAPEGLVGVGNLERKEAEDRAVGYAFDLRDNTLTPVTEPNPTAGTVHTFTAYRVPGDDTPVEMSEVADQPLDAEEVEADLALEDED